MSTKNRLHDFIDSLTEAEAEILRNFLIWMQRKNGEIISEADADERAKIKL